MALPVMADAPADRTSLLPALPIGVIDTPAAHRHRRISLALLLALLVIAGVVVAALYVGNGAAPTGTSTPTTGSQSVTAAIRLKAADYVARPYDDVAQDLRDLGLVPRRSLEVNPAPADTVVRVAEGPFARGDVVMVVVSVGPGAQPQPAPNDKRGHDKKGKG